MTVELDKWALPADGKRVDVNADMGNAMAILHGTDTGRQKNYYYQRGTWIAALLIR